RIVHPQAPDWPYVIGVLTDAAWQRRGIASALLGIAARAVMAGGDAKLSLTVDADSSPAIALYSGLGFVEVWRGPAGS
ncbi:GNAT family N-acetyltransferase, partial [Demequina sp.]|uniref:GNAT family N-acetyltransferase n=1 Tax=Demequina sp. TaxID=2050685 RepID=UPI0025F00B81